MSTVGPDAAIAYSTRRFSFAAGHHYRVAAWSAADNVRAFGSLMTPHGHNYTLDVTVRGPIDPVTGMVVDLAELKRLVPRPPSAAWSRSRAAWPSPVSR